MSSVLDERSVRTPAEDELERLWATPAAERRAPASPPTAGALGPLVGYGWVAFVLLATAVGSTTGAAEVERAAWVGPASYVLLGLLAGAYLAAAAWLRLAFGLSAAAGALGVALGIDCRVSAHHLGAWWMIETAAAVALAGLSVAALARLSRR